MEIRRATPDDSASIGRIRVDTWLVAYDGLVPAEVLTLLDGEQEADRHRARLVTPPSPGRAELVAEVDGDVVGWAAVGASADDPAIGELFALYVLPEHWGTGAGHALLGAAEAELVAAGCPRAMLWVLDGNARADRFYEAHGWRRDGGAKADDRLGGGTAWVAHELRRSKPLGQSD